jgi:hypothetical protein
MAEDQQDEKRQAPNNPHAAALFPEYRHDSPTRKVGRKNRAAANPQETPENRKLRQAKSGNASSGVEMHSARPAHPERLDVPHHKPVIHAQSDTFAAQLAV